MRGQPARYVAIRTTRRSSLPHCASHHDSRVDSLLEGYRLDVRWCCAGIGSCPSSRSTCRAAMRIAGSTRSLRGNADDAEVVPPAHRGRSDWLDARTDQPKGIIAGSTRSLRCNTDDAEVVPPALCGHRDAAPPLYPPAGLLCESRDQPARYVAMRTTRRSSLPRITSRSTG